MKEAENKNSQTPFFGLIIKQHLQISGKTENLAGNELKTGASLAEIFVSRYEGKYILGRSSDVMIEISSQNMWKIMMR